MAGMKKLQKQLNKLQQSEVEAFVDSCAKELAARLLAKVIKRTPVGDYPKGSGKKGGTLRRGWTSKTHEEAAGGTGKGSIAAGLNMLLMWSLDTEQQTMKDGCEVGSC